MAFSNDFFKKVEKKTNVNKETIISLAKKIQQGNLKDEGTLRDVIQELSKMTKKPVTKEAEDKIVNTIINDDVPKGVEKMF